MNIHPTVKEIAAIFSRSGKQLYLVGGAVRDLLRGRKVKDWDLATDALPEEVIAIFRREKIQKERTRGEKEYGGKTAGRIFVVPTGIKHGTVTVHYGDLNTEVTTFRSESGYSDGRRPDRVEFGVSIEADLSRRDFTMNAAAYKLPSGPFLDPFGGRGDIKKRIIRCVGDPNERFAEDGLRPVRAVRFASQLGFAVDEKVIAAIPGALSLTAKVAAERIRDEIDKMLVSGRPSTAFLLMEKTGLLRLLIPELAVCRGVEQDRKNGLGFHIFDVLDHTLSACDFASGGDFASSGGFASSDGLRDDTSRLVRSLAALYHDIGKAETVKIDENGCRTFYRHEKVSSDLAGVILRRFCYSNAVIDRVCHLIEEHMFHYEENWTDAAVRRFVIRAGEENLPDLFALRRADAFGTTGREPPADFLLPFINRIEKTLEKSRALSLKDLAVSGVDLMGKGIPGGKYMGIILKELLEAVIEDPVLNTREKLLEIAEKIALRYKTKTPS